MFNKASGLQAMPLEDGGISIFDRFSGNSHVLNATGAAVYNLADTLTTEEFASKLTSGYLTTLVALAWTAPLMLPILKRGEQYEKDIV